MSCACENQRMGKEKERIRRLAKVLAVMEGKTVGLYVKDDGSYDFTAEYEEIEKGIVEYITPY